MDTGKHEKIHPMVKQQCYDCCF